VFMVFALAGIARANIPSHVNGPIAFQRNDDTRGQIWAIDPTTVSPEAAAVRVTTGPEPEAQPAYGPTTTSDPADLQGVLAFQRLTSGNWDIWRRTTRHVAGQQLQFDPAVLLVGGPGDQTEPAYSRVLQGEPLLAYISNQTGRRELWLRDTGGTLTQLTTEGAGYANPDFAGRFRPVDSTGDGVQDSWRAGLAFESTRGGSHAIWALDIELNSDGRFVAVRDVRLVASGPVALFQPSWQTVNDQDPGTDIVRRRANELLFTTVQGRTSFLDYVEEPWTQAPDGFVAPAVPFAAPPAARFPLTGNPGGDSGAVWAPNGDQVAFVRGVGNNADVWSLQGNGAQPRRLTSRAGADHNPTWQPGSESSVDKVGGHTQPGPVDRSSPPPSRVSPNLKIDRGRWRGSKVRVSGSAGPRLVGRLQVTFACGPGARRRSARRVFPSGGRFALTLPVKRACRRARRATVIVTYGGDSNHTPGLVSRVVRRSR
jgi:hypothetical protein